MNKELQNKLYDKYPSIFIEKDLPKSESCMYWGIAVGPGWYDLIDRTCAKIMEIDTGKQVRFTQVKEKFAMLTIYFAVGDRSDFTIDNITTGESINVEGDDSDKEINDLHNKVYNIINTAAKESGTICEECGKPGTIRDDRHWMLTLCDECNKEDK